MRRPEAPCWRRPRACRSDGALEDLGRRVIAADELDDDVDFRVGYDVVPVGGEGFGRDAQLFRALKFQGAGHLEAKSMP